MERGKTEDMGNEKKNDGFWGNVEKLNYYIGSVFLVLVTSGIFCEIVIRKVFRASFFGMEEFVALAMLILTFIPQSNIQREKGHIKVDLLTKRFNPVLRRKTEIIKIIISLMCSVLLTYGGILYVRRLYLEGAITVLRKWPVFPFYAAFPVGFLLMSLRLYLQLAVALKEKKGEN